MPPTHSTEGPGDGPQLGKRANTVDDLLKSSRKGFEKVNGETGSSHNGQNGEEHLFSVKVRSVDFRFANRI